MSGFKSTGYLIIRNLSFATPDTETFRGLPLSIEALKRGGNATAVLNAADEFAVEYFLSGRISYLAIADYIEAGRTEKVCVSMRNNLYKQLSKAKNYADKLYVLDKCIFVTLNNTLNELIENYKFIHTDTVEARNYYMLLFNDSF